MKRDTGKFVTQKTPGETYKAFIPAALPPKPPLNQEELYPLLEKATHALAELNSIAKTIPNSSLFLYMYVRKEALLSSQIEGTQSSLSDLILFESNQKPEVSLDDVEEVSNYVKAINYALSRIKNGFPLSMRLLKETHALLLAGTRGTYKLPGEVRRSQNWIGGTRPGNALFVPPPAEDLAECLSNLEHFLHDNSMPVLLRAGIAHVQFETIHPFLDGNGRLGRLLIILLLCENDLLDEPILYLSLYLKQNRNTYFNLLGEVRTYGTWETWLEFFLEGVITTSKQAITTALDINKLFAQDLAKISTLGRAQPSCQQILQLLQRLPQLSVTTTTQNLEMSAPTARKALTLMTQLGILQETSAKKRDKVYVYKKYLDILETGAEPF